MNIHKFRNVKGNIRIEIDAETEKEADLILVRTIKNVDDFYSSFE